MLNAPLKLETRLVPRVWGGHQLGQPVNGVPIGEAWVISEDSRVLEGPHAGQTLAELTAQYPQDMLGTHGHGTRFPLLIKLLDCADWLSVQVHPDDEQARELAGPGQLGKTEAWHILHAGPGARIINGIRPGTTEAQLHRAILSGQVMQHAQHTAVQAGETYLIPAGTIHALGPGILLYEVQQTSDLTYRIYDWDRPVTAGRDLHLEHSARVSRPTLSTASPEDGQTLTQCAYFHLEKLGGHGPATPHHTEGQSFHILTITAGTAQLHADHTTHELNQYASMLLPASLGRYQLSGEFHGLRSSLPLPH